MHYCYKISRFIIGLRKTYNNIDIKLLNIKKNIINLKKS